MACNLDPNLTAMESHGVELNDDRYVTRNEDIDMHFVATGLKF